MSDLLAPSVQHGIRQQWIIAFCTVGSVVILISGILIGAQFSNEKRITTLEVQQADMSQTIGRLTTQIDSLREAIGSLTVALQRQNDLAPTEKR